jgi:hypothetical protein
MLHANSFVSDDLVAGFAMTQVPITEWNERMQRFRGCMGAEQRDSELAAIFGRVNQYCFTGTTGQNWVTDEEKSQGGLNRY